MIRIRNVEIQEIMILILIFSLKKLKYFGTIVMNPKITKIK